MLTTQRIQFRLFTMPCCGQLLCWVNPRLPSFCPECGKSVYVEIKSSITLQDNNAVLKVEDGT